MYKRIAPHDQPHVMQAIAEEHLLLHVTVED